MEEQKKNIFLVDDDFLFLNAGKNIIQDKYNVTTMSSADKIFPMLKKIKPDLILLDVEMPGISGYEAIKQMQANPEISEIPVILLTGKNDPEDDHKGLSLGAVDYITKPFSPPLLLKRIELHLLLQSQRNELRGFDENLAVLVKERTNEISAFQDAIIMWAAEMVEFRDKEAGLHVERVQKYLEMLFDEMAKIDHYKAEIDTWDREAFFKSAVLHDIGKIKIEDEILLKKSRLTDDEFNSMKHHVVYGKMLLESLDEKVDDQAFLEYAKTLAYSHHERWDGKGYPDGLMREDIPLQARMMSLADVYDALVSDRPYKSPSSHEEAMRIIAEGRGTQFDPELTDIFLSLSEKLRKVGASENS